MGVEDPESIDVCFHMPSTFLNDDQERIAGVVRIVGVGTNVEVFGAPQAIEETVLRFDLIKSYH
jgi:hypothetical protein